MNLGKKDAKKIRRTLEEAVRHARMVHLAVGHGAFVGRNKPVTFENGRTVTEGNVDDFIRERLQLHHDSWVIGPIEMVLKDLQRYETGGT